MVHINHINTVDYRVNPVRRYARHIGAKSTNNPLVSSIQKSEEEFAKGNGIRLTLEELREMAK